MALCNVLKKFKFVEINKNLLEMYIFIFDNYFGTIQAIPIQVECSQCAILCAEYGT